MASPPPPVSPDTPDGIHDIGHRTFIGGEGGFWDTIGDLQFDFLKRQGLTPATPFLDVACGSLRLGTRLIPYLHRGLYLGIDKHVELVIYGVMSELGEAAFRDRRPRFAVTADFTFDTPEPLRDMAMAQSLFTHLTLADIGLCLERVRPAMAPGGRFFATFFEAEEEQEHGAASHSRLNFRFTRDQMAEAGRRAGWVPHYLGEWGHPRDQRMMVYTAAGGASDTPTAQPHPQDSEADPNA